MAKDSILANALTNFDAAAKHIAGEVPAELLQKIRVPKERVELSLGPQLDDGKVHMFRAFVVRHSDALGPSKGGIRMTGNVTLDDVTGLAMEMTWKCALIGVPFGGGKSGVVADAEKLSGFNKETLIRSFARNATRVIGPQVYVPAPDMGTNERDMGYIKDAICYSSGQATTQGCYVTGKPLILGGIAGRREATGNGVTICIQEALKAQGRQVKGATFIVQGFGNVGSVAAAALHRLGGRVVGVGDVHAAFYDAKGLDIDAMIAFAQKSGTLAKYEGATKIDGKKLLESPCDVLVPAAAANQITAENAGRIVAKLVAEGANSPTSPEADEILTQRKVLVIPDILCNAGGVFVSYLEFTQETQQEQMTEQEVTSRLAGRMTAKFQEVAGAATDRKESMRESAMYLAVKAVAKALTARGSLP